MKSSRPIASAVLACALAAAPSAFAQPLPERQVRFEGGEVYTPPGGIPPIDGVSVRLPNGGTITVPRGTVIPGLACAGLLVQPATPPLPSPEWNTTCDIATEETTFETPTEVAPVRPVTVAGCAPASQARCADPAWIESDCGQSLLDAGQCAPWLPFLRTRFVSGGRANPRESTSLLDALNANGAVVSREVVNPLGASDPRRMYGAHATSSLDPRRLTERVIADPLSFHSQMDALASAQRSGALFANQTLTRWESNGDAMDSCREYVHHRYYDAAHPALLARAYGGDGRAVFDRLYGPLTDRASIGSRAVCSGNDDELRSRDLALPFGRMFDTRPYVSNAFKTTPYDPTAIHALSVESGVAYIPQSVYDAWNHVRDRTCPDGSQHASCSIQSQAASPISWAWHLARSRQLRTMPRIGPDGVSYRPAIAPDRDHPCGGRRTHGYTDEELDYLYALGLRYRALIRQITATVTPNIPDLQAEYVSPYDEVSNPPLVEPVTLLQTQIEAELDGLAAGGGGFVPAGATTFRAATLTPRRRPVSPARLVTLTGVGFELAALLREAERWGCLERGPTPCDWSPRLFAATVADRFVQQEEAAYQQCVRYVEDPSDFSAQRPRPFLFGELGSEVLETRNYNSRSPHFPEFTGHFVVHCGNPAAQAAFCGGQPSYVWGWDFPREDLASAPARMVQQVADPERAGVTHNLNNTSAPFCRENTFFSDSRCHEAFVTSGHLRRATARLASAAPELIGPDGKLHQPGRIFRRAETLGGDGVQLEYSFSTSYVVTGGRLGASSAATELLYGCQAPGQRPAANAPQLDASLRAEVNASVRLFGGEVAQPLLDADVDATMYGLRKASVAVLGSQVLGCGAGADCAGRTDYQFGPRETGDARTLAQGDMWLSVLGIPVHVTLGASRQVGVSARADTRQPTGCATSSDALVTLLPRDGHVTASITPRVGAHAYATAAVDAGIASVGVKGEINILTLTLPTGGTVRVLDVSTAGQPGPSLDVDVGSDVVLTTLDGRVAVYAEIDLGLYSKSAERTVFAWSGLSLDRNAFRSRYTLPMRDMRQITWQPPLTTVGAP